MTNDEENERDEFEDIAARHMHDGVERGEAERLALLELTVHPDFVDVVQRVAAEGMAFEQLRELRQRDRGPDGKIPRGPDGMILLGEVPRGTTQDGTSGNRRRDVRLERVNRYDEMGILTSCDLEPVARKKRARLEAVQ